MKTISRMMMTIVLLLVALTASAQYKTEGTINSLSWREGMTYSFSGGRVREKETPEKDCIEYTYEVEEGTDLSFSCSRTKSPKKGGSVPQVEIFDKNGKRIKKATGVETASITYHVPLWKKEFTVTLGISLMSNTVAEVVIKCIVIPKKKKSLYNNLCPHCHHKDSKIRFNDFYGEVKIRCSFEEDDSYEFVDLDTEIFEDDLIRTEEESGAILGLEDMSTYIIYPETKLIIHTEEDNTPKWKMLAGSMIVTMKKMIGGKSFEVELSQSMAGIDGTIVAFEETGKESRIWLFAGSVSVKSKKTGKKTKLQPGQRSIPGKNGVVQVKSFNIEEGAKKFGIKMSDINNHYSNKNNASAKGKNDRYNVKCAVVKYKYTKGKVTGQHERAFDNYGKLERRTFKTASTETISYYRDKKVYNLDVKKKTMTVKTDNQLNFGNPDDPNIKKKRKSGSATILGKSCAIYQSGKTDYYVWKGIVLKKVEHLKDGGVATTVATSIQQPSSLNASMFEVPKGYKTK